MKNSNKYALNYTDRIINTSIPYVYLIKRIPSKYGKVRRYADLLQ